MEKGKKRKKWGESKKEKEKGGKRRKNFQVPQFIFLATPLFLWTTV